MSELSMNPTPSGGSITGESKRSLTKNRWAAQLLAVLEPTDGGTVVKWRVNMNGTKHYEILDEISEELSDDIFDDLGVNAAVGRLSGASRLFGRKEIRHLRNILHAGERVVELAQGQYKGKQGLLVLTPERLFFFEKSVGAETIDDFPLESINSVTSMKKMTGEALVVHSSGNQVEIKNMSPGQANAITEAFRQLRRPPSAAAPESPSDSPLAQLEKLSQLRDQGVLTAEEFERAKAKLIERL